MKKTILFIMILLLFSITFCGRSNEKTDDLSKDLNPIKVENIYKGKDFEKPISILDEKPNIKLKIGICKSVSGGLLLLADGLGFFEEQGLYPDFIVYPNNETLVNTFRYGNIDVAPIGLYDSMILLLNDVEFLGVVPMTYKGTLFATSNNSKITEFSKLKDAKLGLTKNSIDLFLLHKGLEIENKINISDIKIYYLPREIMLDAFNKKYIDGGFFNSFYSPNFETTNVLYDPTRFGSYRVETLLINKQFMNEHREAIKLIIRAYKKALMTYIQNKTIALQVICDANRLNVNLMEFEKALGYEPIIPIMDTTIDGIASLQKNETTMRNDFFHPNGIYNKEALEIINFIMNNIEEYKDPKYKENFEDIYLKLLRSKCFNILYLAETGFEYIKVEQKKITPEMKEKWKTNIVVNINEELKYIDYSIYGINTREDKNNN